MGIPKYLNLFHFQSKIWKVNDLSDQRYLQKQKLVMSQKSSNGNELMQIVYLELREHIIIVFMDLAR